MNYKMLYHRFIENRRQHPVSPGIYSERHHIVPQCEGGSDDPSNLIRLTARDHLFAHLILAKWKGGVHWASLNWVVARRQRHPTAQEIRVAALARGRYSFPPEFGERCSERLRGNQFRKGKPQPAEAVEKQRRRLKGNQFRKGIPHSEETKARIRASCKGQPKSEEWKAKARAAWSDPVRREERLKTLKAPDLTGFKHSNKTKQKMSAAHKGRKHSAETKAKMRAAWERRRAT